MRSAGSVVAVLVSCVLASGALAASNPGASKELVAAEEAYKSNIVLGDSLAGKPPTMENVADAQSFYQEAVAQAQAAVAANPDLAEAHRLLGLILCTAYRAVEVEADPPEGSEEGEARTVFVLRRGGSECEQGLTELRAAMGLAKSQFGYRVDYAEALLICGDKVNSEQQANDAWKQSLGAPERARCARLLVQIARDAGKTQDEIRWLRELVKYDPEDKAASQRLAKLAPPPATAKPKTQNAIAWVEYEAGIEQAGKQNRPILALFSASWCPTCRKLATESLTDKNVIAESRKFVCIRVDTDERQDLSDSHNTHLIPTTLVLNSEGTEVARLVGYYSPEDYVAELETGLAATKGTN
jgi:thiol-disulfide isomerase/thioredoxin